MEQKALEWLYSQLRKKRIALGQAERKPNCNEDELKNIQTAIEVIEWITEMIMRGNPK